MISDFISDYLAKCGFRKIKTKSDRINFLIKAVNEKAYVCAVIKMTDGWSMNREAFGESFINIQRKFYLNGFKDVEIMHIILTDNFGRDRQIAEENMNCWIVDISAGRLVIYENQPEDYLKMRKPLENALENDCTDERSRLINIPVVSIAIIAVNVVVFLLLEMTGSTEDAYFMLKHGAANWQLIFESGEYYRLFTCMFLHFGISHLVNNMFMLAAIGMNLEKAIGKINYLIIYIASGLIASVSSALYYMYTDSASVSAGASGAIFGLLGCLLWVIIKDSRRTKRPVGTRLLFLVVILVFGSVTAEGVDYVAHIAGLVSGFIMGIICEGDS